MPEREINASLQRFTRETLPPVVGQQITDFIRIYWYEHHLYSLDPPRMGETEVAWSMVEGDVLYSHAAVVFTDVICNGETYASGGLSAVLTYTSFRKRGFGRMVVEACNREIDNSAMDVAILWTGDDRIAFYTHLGWEVLPNAVTTKGDAENPEVHFEDGVIMARFVSERGKAARADFESKPIYIGKHGW